MFFESSNLLYILLILEVILLKYINCAIFMYTRKFGKVVLVYS